MLDFELAKQGAVPDALNSFSEMGIQPSRRLLVIETSKLPEILLAFEKNMGTLE